MYFHKSGNILNTGLLCVLCMHKNVCMYIRIYVCTCTCMYVYMYACTRRTYIHTHNYNNTLCLSLELHFLRAVVERQVLGVNVCRERLHLSHVAGAGQVRSSRHRGSLHFTATNTQYRSFVVELQDRKLHVLKSIHFTAPNTQSWYNFKTKNYVHVLLVKVP